MLANGALEPRLAAPPRRVPRSLRLWLLFAGPATAAWLWFGIGSAMSIFFLRQADWSWVHSPAATARAQGLVEGCTKTRAAEGGSETRVSSSIYAHRFQFQDTAGNLTHGVSYAPDRCLDADSVVEVEYDAHRPSSSHIVGMRRAAFGRMVFFILVFPLLGVGFIALHSHEALRSLRLLEHGRLVRGRLVGEEDAGFVQEVGWLTKLLFRIEGDGAQPAELTVTTTTPPQRLKDEGYAWLLYHPARPDHRLVRDAIPRGVTVDPDGQLQFGRPLAMALVLVFPIATLIVQALTLTMKL